MRYRTAAIGVLIGFILIMAFCLKAGMSLWFAILFFALYFAMSVTITRIRAELGPPAHDLYNAGPDLLLTDALGTRRIGNRNLSVMSLFFWLNHLSYRAHPMPHQLEGLKLAHQTPLQSVPTALGISNCDLRGCALRCMGTLTSLLPSRPLNRRVRGMPAPPSTDSRDGSIIRAKPASVACSILRVDLVLLSVCCSCDGGSFSGPYILSGTSFRVGGHLPDCGSRS